MKTTVVIQESMKTTSLNKIQEKILLQLKKPKKMKIADRCAKS